MTPGAFRSETGDVSDSDGQSWPGQIAKAFRDGRGPALWVLGIGVGLVAGYATLALRLGISAVERGASALPSTAVVGGISTCLVFLSSSKKTVPKSDHGLFEPAC